MSADRKWPEGVPPLLAEHIPDHFIVMTLLTARGKRHTWKRRASYYDAHSASRVAERQPRHTPRVVVSRRHQRILYANAAARALGIIPDGEQNNER